MFVAAGTIVQRPLRFHKADSPTGASGDSAYEIYSFFDMQSLSVDFTQRQTLVTAAERERERESMRHS